MHLDFVAEGIAHELAEFEKWWSTRVANIPIKDKKGKIKQQPIQVALRERKAYSLVFPKEYLDVVLNTLNPENGMVTRVDGKGTRQFKNLFMLMRSILKLKRIPTPDKTKGGFPMIPFKNVRVVGLGVRDDIDLVEKNGDVHEGL